MCHAHDQGHEWDSHEARETSCEAVALTSIRVREPVRLGGVTRWIITVTDLE